MFYIDKFDKEMAHFKEEMRRAKKEWERTRLENRRKIEWKCRLNTNYWDGTYEGELKDNRPHGRGKWSGFIYKCTNTVEGEWKDGVPHGKVIYTWSDGHAEYEATTGKYHGKKV